MLYFKVYVFITLFCTLSVTFAQESSWRCPKGKVHEPVSLETTVATYQRVASEVSQATDAVSCKDAFFGKVAFTKKFYETRKIQSCKGAFPNKKSFKKSCGKVKDPEKTKDKKIEQVIGNLIRTPIGRGLLRSFPKSKIDFMRGENPDIEDKAIRQELTYSEQQAKFLRRNDLFQGGKESWKDVFVTGGYHHNEKIFLFSGYGIAKNTETLAHELAHHHYDKSAFGITMDQKLKDKWKMYKDEIEKNTDIVSAISRIKEIERKKEEINDLRKDFKPADGEYVNLSRQLMALSSEVREIEGNHLDLYEKYYQVQVKRKDYREFRGQVYLCKEFHSYMMSLILVQQMSCLDKGYLGQITDLEKGSASMSVFNGAFEEKGYRGLLESIRKRYHGIEGIYDEKEGAKPQTPIKKDMCGPGLPGADS